MIRLGGSRCHLQPAALNRSGMTTLRNQKNLRTRRNGPPISREDTVTSKKRLTAMPVAAYRDRALKGVQAPGLIMVEDVMNRLENVLCTVKAHTTGGRARTLRSSDCHLQVGKRTRAYG